ncbi:unnamed protein product [Microthlaspi erraticum]|uniref:Uncharacterized protein n=1 Tax=Microthlaspi erraticum TaxID=1685480 RepID=A0A6D2IPE0_9BRAS|nr:unnamed protein product [Microthlaspi erraticum]
MFQRCTPYPRLSKQWELSRYSSGQIHGDAVYTMRYKYLHDPELGAVTNFNGPVPPQQVAFSENQDVQCSLFDCKRQRLHGDDYCSQFDRVLAASVQESGLPINLADCFEVGEFQQDQRDKPPKWLFVSSFDVPDTDRFKWIGNMTLKKLDIFAVGHYLNWLSFSLIVEGQHDPSQHLEKIPDPGIRKDDSSYDSVRTRSTPIC